MCNRRGRRLVQIIATGLVASLVFSGCGHVNRVRPEVGVRSFSVGKEYRISMGETLFAIHGGSWLRTYTPLRAIAIDGLKTIEPGKAWVSQYSKPHDAYLLLTESDFYHGAIAIRVTPDGRVAPTDALTQVLKKRWRTWTVTSDVSEPLFRPSGFVPDLRRVDQSGYIVTYVGPDGPRMRFIVDDFGPRGIRRSRVEYWHDRSAGNEFVIRGTRVLVHQILSDGQLEFLIKEATN